MDERTVPLFPGRSSVEGPSEACAACPAAAFACRLEDYWRRQLTGEQIVWFNEYVKLAHRNAEIESAARDVVQRDTESAQRLALALPKGD